MKKYLILLLGGMFFEVSGVDLEDAVVSAYMNNEKLHAENANKETADKQYLQSQMIFLPTLSGSISSTRSGNDVSAYSTTWDGVQHYRDVRKSTMTNMGVELRQNIFNGFKDRNTMKSRKHLSKAAYHKLKKVEGDLIVGVVKAYTAVWAERQKLEAYAKKEQNLFKLYKSQQICLNEGMSTPADVAEAESKYQNAVYERVEAETRVAEAEAEFKQITGISADKKMFVPKIDIKLPESLDKLKSIALASNQEILMERYNKRSAYNELGVAKGELAPKCEASVAIDRRLDKPESRFENSRSTNNQYSVKVSVTVPIVNVPNYVGIEVSNKKAIHAEFMEKDKILEIEKQCEVYWTAYKAAEASIKASSAAVKSAESTSESNLDQANLGMKSNTEFLDGETSLLTARIHFADAIKNKVDVLIQLVAITGQLNYNTMLDTLKNNKGIWDPVVTDKKNAATRAKRKRKYDYNSQSSNKRQKLQQRNALR